MKFVDRYPVVVTRHQNACRDFWSRYLDFDVAFDSSWFCLLCAKDASASIAFMSPSHPSAPPGADEFSGKGVCFELQVGDVYAAHAEFAARGAKVDYALATEPFGQRRFGFFDPSGLWVDVVQQVESAPGYWDKYM